MTEEIELYIRKVNEQNRTGIAKERAHRGALGELVNALLPQLLATNEPVHVACGAPDFAVCDRKSHQVGFYIEAKDVEDGDLGGHNVRREQFDRYRDIVFDLGETRRIMDEIRRIGEMYG